LAQTMVWVYGITIEIYVNYGVGVVEWAKQTGGKFCGGFLAGVFWGA